MDILVNEIGKWRSSRRTEFVSQMGVGSCVLTRTLAVLCCAPCRVVPPEETRSTTEEVVMMMVLPIYEPVNWSGGGD